MKKRERHIGSFSNQWLIEDFTAKFHSWMASEMILWFYWVVYDEKEIVAKFENSDGILAKRKQEMWFISLMAQDSEIYSIDYIVNLIKTNLTKLYPSLPTLAKFKADVEGTYWTGTSTQHIKDMMTKFVNDYYAHRTLGFIHPDIQVDRFCPLLHHDEGEVNPLIAVRPYDPSVDYDKDYRIDIWGFMVDTNTGTYYVDSNGSRISSPVLAPGITTMLDPIGNPAVTANRLAWNQKLRPVHLYGDFNIDESGYMVSQTDPNKYVNAYGVEIPTKQLVNGLTAPLTASTIIDSSTTTSSLAGYALPIAIVGAAIIGLLSKKNKTK